MKAYRGSPGILEVAGRACGHMESWHKWSFPISPLSQDDEEVVGWRPASKRRRISRFSLASEQTVVRAPVGGQQLHCEVELTVVRPACRMAACMKPLEEGAMKRARAVRADTRVVLRQRHRGWQDAWMSSRGTGYVRAAAAAKT